MLEFLIQLISSWLQGLLQSACVRAKHFVLKRAHPRPDRIEVFPGKEGTIEHVAVTAAMRSLPEVEVVDQTDGLSAFIRLDGEVTATGWQPIVRYLGIMNYSMPTTPENALIVDMFLTIFASMIENPPTTQEELDYALAALESSLQDDEMSPTYLGRFESMTIADIVGQAIISRIISSLPEEFNWTNSPLTSEWYHSLICAEVVHLDEMEGDSSDEDASECDAKKEQ